MGKKKSSETQEKLKNKLLGIYVVSIVIVLTFLYLAPLPAEIAQYLTDTIPGVSGKIIEVDESYQQTVIAITNTTTTISLLFTIFAAIFIMRRRSIVDIFALLALNMLPKDRKYWGTVYDRNKNEYIPFAIVRLYVMENNVKKIIAQTVTDIYGRYRLKFDQSVHKKAILQVTASGYQDFEMEVKQFGTLTQDHVFTQDIGLVKSSEKISSWKELYYQIRPRAYSFLMWFIYAFSIISIPVALFAVINNPVFVNILYLVAMSITVSWNTVIIKEWISPDRGRLFNAETGDAAKNLTVALYQDNEQIESQQTDSEGIPNFSSQEGDYFLFIPKSTKIQFIPIRINKEGYITRHIYVEGLGENVPEQKLLNPFN